MCKKKITFDSMYKKKKYVNPTPDDNDITE